jgi:hypothetical protein
VRKILLSKSRFATTSSAWDVPCFVFFNTSITSLIVLHIILIKLYLKEGNQTRLHSKFHLYNWSSK